MAFSRTGFAELIDPDIIHNLNLNAALQQSKANHTTISPLQNVLDFMLQDVENNEMIVKVPMLSEYTSDYRTIDVPHEKG